jgi:hypothetical protein
MPEPPNTNQGKVTQTPVIMGRPTQGNHLHQHGPPDAVTSQSKDDCGTPGQNDIILI